jgi:hypothetical protein
MLPAGEESVAVPKSSIMPISVHSWKLDYAYRDIVQWGEREQRAGSRAQE